MVKGEGDGGGAGNGSEDTRGHPTTRPGGLQSPCSVNAHEIWYPGPTFHGGTQPGAGERFRSGDKTPIAPCAGKAEGKAQSEDWGPLRAAPEPGFHLGRNFAGGDGEVAADEPVSLQHFVYRHL